MDINCPNGHRLQVPSESAGTQVQCPKCRQVFIAIEAAPGPAPVPTPSRSMPSPEPQPVEMPVIAERRQRSRSLGPLNFDVLSFMKPIAQPLLLMGLVLVLGSRGCDSVMNRYVARAQVAAKYREDQWNDKWKDRFNKLTREEETIRNRRQASPNDSQRLTELSNERTKLKETQEEERRTSEATWEDLEHSARDAQANNQMSGIWREAVFVLGTMVLSVGLLAAGFTLEGPGRWICMVMLAIVIFSLYIGGIAWISSVSSLMRGG